MSVRILCQNLQLKLFLNTHFFLDPVFAVCNLTTFVFYSQWNFKRMHSILKYFVTINIKYMNLNIKLKITDIIIHSKLTGADIIIKRLLHFSTAFENKRTFIQRLVMRAILYLWDGLFVLCAFIRFEIMQDLYFHCHRSYSFCFQDNFHIRWCSCRLTVTNQTKNRKWTQVLRNDKKFLFHFTSDTIRATVKRHEHHLIWKLSWKQKEYDLWQWKYRSCMIYFLPFDLRLLITPLVSTRSHLAYPNVKNKCC
jgi:hypothetical protein